MQDANSNGLPAITQDSAKQKLAIALTKATLSVQALQDEADGLTFNEDQENLNAIAVFLGKTGKSEKVVEGEHKILKEPFLEGGRACDAAKKDMLAAISAIKTPVQARYNTLCDKIATDKKKAEQEKEAERVLLAGIESNVLSFSQKIANCSTRKELNDVERLINLEKSPSRATKYGNHHQKAIDRYDEVLLPILKDQKTKIEEKEKLEKELEKTDDPEKHDELKGKLEEKENEIIQNQVKVQEDALKQKPEDILEPEIILPEVKAKRTDIVPEIVDLNQAFKKCPELLNIELKVMDAKKLGKTLQEAGAFGDKEELIVNGIKYTIKKSW